MPNSDLNSMPLEKLRKLRKDVEKAIQTFQDRKKSEARLKLEQVARDFGYTLSELVEKTVTKTRRPAAPKYCNPADQSQTWTGRGRKPRWVIDGLASGKSLDDMKIGK